MAERRAGQAGGREASVRTVAPAAIGKDWAGGKLPRAVLVAGAETALREEALTNIRKAAFGAGDGGLSWIVFHGPQTDDEQQALTPAEILDEVRTRPLFGGPDEPKLVVVRRADLLLVGGRQSADQRRIFEDNLAGIPPEATLVFEVAQPGVLKNTGFYKTIAAAGGLVNCEPLRNPYELDGADSRLADELIRRGVALNLTLDPAAAAALIARVGQDLGVLQEELAKMALALGTGPERRAPVNEQDVARLCAQSRLAGPFEFAEAVAARETKAALEALHAIFAHGLGDYKRPGRVITNEGDIAMRLLAAVTYRLTQLQDVQLALASGAREWDAFQAAKVFGASRQEATRRAVRRHTAASLRTGMEALLTANLALRGNRERREVLEDLVWTVCGGPRAGQ